MDGVNPFGLRSSLLWRTWPVVLVNYNIPSWLAIKKGHLLLSLILPRKHKVKNMDVYLAPLIDELLVLWNGVMYLMHHKDLDISKQQFMEYLCGPCTIGQAIESAQVCVIMN